MMQYIYDFLSILFDKLKEKEKIRNIILFGSFARGNPRKDSDVDLFIDVEKETIEEVEKLVKESLKEFEIKAERSWKLKGIKNTVSPIVDSIENERWNNLRKDIEINGISLYGKFKGKAEKNKHLVLIQYDLSKLSQKNKMQLIRKLFGYTLKKGKKVYANQGIIQKLKAEKLSNAILIDLSNYKEVLEILRKHKASVKIEDLW